MITVDYAMRVATDLQGQNKLEQAEIILNTILEVIPAHAYALHLSGIIAYQAGKIPAAIQLIQQAIDNNPNVALFHSNLGEMHRQLKDIETSIQCGQRAVTLDPNSATALSNLGIAYYDAKNYSQAEKYHQRALAIQPKLSCSLNNMGSIHKAYGNTQQAIAFFQAAIAASPNFIDPINNLIALLIEQHEFIHAEHTIKRAIIANPKHLEFYQALSEVYCEQGKHTQALTYLDHALSMNPTLASLHLSKGKVLMEMGEISNAEAQFSKVTNDTVMDNRILAYYSLVQLRKIKSDNPSLPALLAIANNPKDVTPNNLEYLYFALGKCFDDLAEYQKAFNYFAQGCNLKRQRINYSSKDQIQFTEKLIRVFTPEIIKNLRKFASPSALPIFIVGMPRSGTTLVEQILASHPNVFGAGELTYLYDLIQRPTENKLPYPENILQFSKPDYHAITDKYLAFLRDFSSTATRITDKMPHNFIAIGLIHALLPNAKIIHVKRNSIDTCLSCYTKLFTKGHFYSYDLTELGQYYNCYEEIMQHWRRVLPSNAFLDINYEDIAHNPEMAAKELLAFCDLTWDPTCLAFYQAKRQVRTASFMQVRQPVYTSSVQRWRRFEKELAPLIKVLNFIDNR